MQLRLALIGAGRWGRRYIDTIGSMYDTFCLSAVVSSNPETKNLVPTNCFITPSWADILKPESFDGVIIATPPSSHGKILAHCIKQKLAVVVEKPLTVDLAEAEELAKLAASYTKPIIVNHIYLFHPAYEAIKAALPAIGKIQKIHSEGGNRGPFRADYSSLWDYGSHDLSMILDLCKETPKTITCKRSQTPGEGSKPAEVFKLDMTFNSGVRAQAVFGNGMTERRRKVVIEGARGVIEFVDGPASLHLNGKPLDFSSYPPLNNMLLCFAQSITSTLDPRCGLDLAMATTRILDKCAQSFE